MIEQESLIAHLETVKDRVEFILRYHVQARNNDFYLELKYLEYFENLKFPWIRNSKIEELSGRLETVRRMRQKLQNEEHLFPPEDQTKVNRMEKAEAMKQVLPRLQP